MEWGVVYTVDQHGRNLRRFLPYWDGWLETKKAPAQELSIIDIKAQFPYRWL